MIGPVGAAVWVGCIPSGVAGGCVAGNWVEAGVGGTATGVLAAAGAGENILLPTLGSGEVGCCLARAVVSRTVWKKRCTRFGSKPSSEAVMMVPPLVSTRRVP